MLEGRNISKYFGGLAALKNVYFKVTKGVIKGLIGPNGAGKTTLFNVIMGVYKPDSGVIKFKGENIIGLKTNQICKRGIGRTFQIVKPFKDLSVWDNVTMGVLFGRRNPPGVKEARDEALMILDFMGLKGKREVLAKNLTLADKKSLEIARALATKPEILLLDEVVAGLNPTETINMIKRIKRIRDELGITILIVEHVMRAVMEISDEIMVLHHGEKIAEGEPCEITRDERVIEAYLGEKYIF